LSAKKNSTRPKVPIACRMQGVYQHCKWAI
jgi:hypothetical protein